MDFTSVGASGRPLKVLNVAETIKGGVATYLSGLEIGSDAIGCRFAHLIPEAQKNELTGDQIFYHGASRSLGGILRLTVRLVAVQKSLQADIIFAHSTYAGIALCLARPFLGWRTKTIYCPHGWAIFREMPRVTRKLVWLVELAMSHVPSVVVNISRFEHDAVKKKAFSKRCVLISNAVSDVDGYLPRSYVAGKPLRVLFVGRFDRQKGADILFDAIRQLVSISDASMTFDIVGDHVLADGPKLERPASSNVNYHGWLSRDAIISLYAEADVLVMPSRWEGFGLCAIEALRVGTPVLARSVGALPEIVSHGVNGYLFDGESAALAESLSRLTRGGLHQMRGNARKTFETRFHLDRLHRRYRELFANLYGHVSAGVGAGR